MEISLKELEKKLILIYQIYEEDARIDFLSKFIIQYPFNEKTNLLLIYITIYLFRLAPKDPRVLKATEKIFLSLKASLDPLLQWKNFINHEKKEPLLPSDTSTQVSSLPRPPLSEKTIMGFPQEQPPKEEKEEEEAMIDIAFEEKISLFEEKPEISQIQEAFLEIEIPEEKSPPKEIPLKKEDSQPLPKEIPQKEILLPKKVPQKENPQETHSLKPLEKEIKNTTILKDPPEKNKSYPFIRNFLFLAELDFRHMEFAPEFQDSLVGLVHFVHFLISSGRLLPQEKEKATQTLLSFIEKEQDIKAEIRLNEIHLLGKLF